MSQKFFCIFFVFSKWPKIEIQKPITEPWNSPKGNWSSVICDVKPGLQDSRVVTSIKAETNPDRCVVFGCSNVQSKTKGILLHPIPFYGKSRSVKQKRRRKWVDFVKSKCAYWEPSKHSAVCSEHFTEEDYRYTNQFALAIQQLQPDLYLQVDRWHIPLVCLPSIFKFGKPTCNFFFIFGTSESEPEDRLKSFKAIS